MKLTDTHAHLDGFIKNGALAETLERAKRAGVERVITCSTNPADWISYRDAAEKHPEIFWQAGIHPEDISDDSDTALDALPSLFVGGGRLPVAVGEIGLDFHFLPDNPEESERKKLRQREIFARQLRIAADLGLRVCVHARGAIDECIAEIERARLDFSNAVFHCFAGSPEKLAELNERGARASFTGIITYRNAGEMRAAMLAQGLGKLMLETDCPYLAPVPRRGKTCEPAMLADTARAAAEIFGVSPEYIAEKTEENTEEFFNLSQK